MADSDLLVAQALADVATIGILHQRVLTRGAQVNSQLQTALNSRIVIEQAKGVLAERQGIDMDQAFLSLRSMARSTNRHLSDTARAVIENSSDIVCTWRQSHRPERRPSGLGLTRGCPRLPATVSLAVGRESDSGGPT